jgi:hypothetical protein
MTPVRGEIGLASDMQATGARAGAEQIPILLVVTQEHCPFCHRIKEEILRPMLISGEYERKVLIQELLIDPGETLRDFRGRQRTAREFADGYKVWVTPTLLYLGPDGRELRPRILGVNTLEMYGYYVDEGIDESLRRLRGGEAKSYIPTEEDIGDWPPQWDGLFY